VTLKGDLFKDRKACHIELDTQTHMYFRRELFTVGLTMQEAFEAFARLVASGDHKTKEMLKSFVTKKLRKEIDKVTASAVKRPTPFNELDADQLYDLIGDTSSDGQSKDEK
jgi:hypothetical protein